MQLKTSTRTFGQATVIDCSGRIVFGDETTYLRDQVKEALDGSKQVVLNLAQVNYIDSSGVGTLMGLYATAQATKATIKLAGLLGRVKDVLVITRLGSFFETFDTAEEAANSFNAGGQNRAAG